MLLHSAVGLFCFSAVHIVVVRCVLTSNFWHIAKMTLWCFAESKARLFGVFADQIRARQPYLFQGDFLLADQISVSGTPVGKGAVYEFVVCSNHGEPANLLHCRGVVLNSFFSSQIWFCYSESQEGICMVFCLEAVQ